MGLFGTSFDIGYWIQHSKSPRVSASSCSRHCKWKSFCILHSFLCVLKVNSVKLIYWIGKFLSIKCVLFFKKPKILSLFRFWSKKNMNTTENLPIFWTKIGPNTKEHLVNITSQRTWSLGQKGFVFSFRAQKLLGQPHNHHCYYQLFCFCFAVS